MKLITEDSNPLSHSLFQSNSIRKQKKHFTVGKNTNSSLFSNQYNEGFTAFSSSMENFDQQWLKDSGRSYAVTNPTDPETLPEQFRKASSRSKRKRYQNKVLNLWHTLIPQDENFGCKSDMYSIESSRSENIPCISTEQSREEYYLPFSYSYKDQVTGGNYIYAWEAGTAEQLKLPRASVKDRPFAEFFTGGCLFGAPLYGIDQFGNRHSLTSPGHNIPEGSIIDSVEAPYDIHPDETLTRESVANILHMIKSLGNDQTVLKYHLPLANYIVYGLNWFLKGKLTQNSLAEYIKTVLTRVAKQKSYLKSLGKTFAITINTCSSLDQLGMDLMEPDSFVKELLQKLGIEAVISSSMTLEERTLLKQKIFTGVLDYMKNLDGPTGKVWTHIDSRISDQSINSDQYNLLVLNYVDYSANLAISSLLNGERLTASILPANECPVNHWYKKVFAEEFGAVTCFQWLPPIQVQDETYKQRVFYLTEFIEDINSLLQQGLIRYNFLKTAAIAVNDTKKADEITKKISAIMRTHEKSLNQNIYRENLLLDKGLPDVIPLRKNAYAS
ncbi:MAG: hypothetical protein NE328_06980 [Lentisphaeraceae bacterium]|nr:hypothetical protein [Lentisphaeraceae bacterium]